MRKDLSAKVGEMDFDGLITDISAVFVQGGTIAHGEAKATLKRGTVLAKSATSGKLYILGTSAAEGDTLSADCILCDDVEVGTTADEKVAVYTKGCFDPNKVIVGDSYTMTEADKDELRKKNIYFKAAFAK